MNNLTETQKAYIAGFIDGEGTISISKTGYVSTSGENNYTTLLRVGNTNKEVLETIRNWTGLGYVKIFSTKWSTERKNNKPLWKWQMAANQMRELLPVILPYLLIKKRVAKLALELLGDKPRVRGRHVSQELREKYRIIVKEAQELNQRGVSI